MKNIKMKQALFIIISSVFFVSALTTMVPGPEEVPLSLLNYRAVCPFSPLSTMVLIFLGHLFVSLLRKSK